MFRPAAAALVLKVTLISTAAWAQQDIKACNSQITARILVSPAIGAGSTGVIYRLWMRYAAQRTAGALPLTVRFTGAEGVTAEPPGFWNPRVTTDGPPPVVQVVRAPWNFPAMPPTADHVLRGVQITCP